MSRYSDIEKEFIISNADSLTIEELRTKFNNHFATNRNHSSIYDFCRRNNLKFINGNNLPRKKGKGTQRKRPGFKPSNGFKKGGVPKSTYKKVGSESDEDGFIIVKIADPNIWMLKHRFLYEKYHGIKLTRYQKIIFLDGNKRNFDINNLVLLSNSEQSAYIKFSKKLVTNPEINNIYLNLAKINSKIRNLGNGKNEKN